MKRILCLWLPLWPIQRLIAARPELKNQVLILYTRKGNRGQRVTACSAEASAIGVCPEMPLVEATALANQSKPAIRGNQESAAEFFHVELEDPAADRNELERLAEWCEEFSPIVGLEATRRTPGDCDEPESLLLDVTGLAALFGGEDSLAAKLTTALAARGYTGRVSIADSIGAAWAMARFTAGISILPVREGMQRIGPLPLTALRLPAATIDTLRQLGIDHVDQLLQIPRASLSSRFGDIVLLRIDQAAGKAREMIVVHRPPPVFQSSWIFEYPTEQREVLEFVVQQLLERVAHLLAEQCQGALRLEIRLRFTADGATADKKRELALCLGLFRPTASASHLWELTQLQLERSSWPGAVEKISIQALLTAPLETRQGELFEDSVRDGQRQLSRLIERLSSRLGTEAVLEPRLLSDAQPDRACRYVPLAGRRTRKAIKETSANFRFQAADRPLQLEHPAIPLQVVISLAEGPPARFRDRRRWHTVARYWGPERIETGWWRGRSVRRDYYRVETEEGLWFWLFRTLDASTWYLQGRFG